MNYFHKNAAGEYIYSGNYYKYATEEKPRKQAMIELWILCGVATAATLMGACIPVPGLSRYAYVLVPYVAAIITACSLLWSLGQLSAGGDPLREYVYKVTVKKLPRRTILTGFFSALTVIGEVIYLVLNRSEGKISYAIIFLVGEIIAVVSAMFARIAFSKLSWSKSENKDD